MEKLFAFGEVIRDEADFCNMQSLKRKLLEGAIGGRQHVLYGLRDTGKTSILKSIVVPGFLRSCEERIGLKPFVFFCDLLGAKTLESIANRLKNAFQNAFADAFPTRSLFMSAAELITSLRPVASFGSSGKLSLSLESLQGKTSPDLGLVLTTILEVLQKNAATYRALLVFDEFQDIALVPEAEAIFRDFLQNLPKNTGAIISGSKKHLLSKIFAPAKSPLAGWGESVSIEPIPYEEYTEYINKRLGKAGIVLKEDVSKRLQDYLGRIPEPINLICQRLCDAGPEITDSDEPHPGLDNVDWNRIQDTIDRYLSLESGKFEEQLKYFSASEEKLLTAMATFKMPVAPYSQEFMHTAGLSQGGVQKILPKLLNNADVYEEKDGYVIAQPLLALYLVRSRG